MERARSTGRFDVEPVWRLTFELEAKLGVRNELSDVTGREIARVLGSVDAMVTTPSTCMLEGMLHSTPVALLDYHNCPHYVPAAWSITAPDHLDQVMPEILSPPPTQMLYQDTILHDALECHTPALPRLVRLIEEMIRAAKECRESGRPLAFPRRILRDEQDGHHLREERFDLGVLYPDQVVFEVMDRAALQAEIGHLRFQHRQDDLEIETLRKRLAARDPVVWLRAAYRAVWLPQALRRLLSSRHGRRAGRQVPSLAAQARVTTPSHSAGGEREGSDV
jgi:hypothetical protein